MQQFTSVTVKRPWHWGIAVLSDPSQTGDLADLDPGARVSANSQGIVIRVRHAQDVESDSDSIDWADATVTVRHWPGVPENEEGNVAVFEGALPMPTGRLSIGDADHEVVMSGLPTTSLLRVLSLAEDLDSPDQVWVDIWPT